MATNQVKVTEIIAQRAAEAAGMAVKAMEMASGESNQRAQNAGPIIDSPLMRQPTFNWSSTEKYAELGIFRMEVKDMLQNYKYKSGRTGTHHKKWDRQASPTTRRTRSI